MKKAILVARRQAGGIFITGLFVFLALATGSRAAIPPAERLLPADTLLVVTVPDCTKMRAIYEASPLGKLWNDPAMKPFHDRFITNLTEQFVTPLKRDLGVKLDDYSALLQGQLTFAVTKEEWNGQGDSAPALLLLLDAKDKSDLLKKNLADLRKKWVDAGKPIKTEKIRDVEFSIVPLSTNDVPKTLRQFFPQHQEIQELGKEPASKDASKSVIVVGQYESLLIAGSSVKAVEKVMARLTGGSVPALADEAAFEANRLAMFRDAPLFAWFNAKAVFEVLGRLPEEKPNPEAPSPLPTFSMSKLISASGLGALKTLAFDFRNSSDGITYEIFVGAPEGSRRGLSKILAVENKDSNPPIFVPGNVVKFQRWRIDGQKAVAAFEKMLSEISPQTFNTWNFLLSSGNEAAKQGDQTYDLRKDLIGGLGDDWISYEKVPRGNSAAELSSPPSLLLIGSPNADKLVLSLKGVLVILSPDATKPQEREFLGRKIYSIKMPQLPMTTPAPSAPRTLHYAASAGYVAFSTDVSLLEEYLRSGEGQSKPLRETPGLTEAAQKVGGQNTGLFAYENQSETMRVSFETLKKSVGGPTNRSSNPLNPLASSIPFAGPEKSYKDWMDYSLLPSFDRVAKYFYYTVHAGSANVDGITFKFFCPTPPALKK